MRKLAFCAILAAGKANASAQAVTATSGDSAAIAAIQATLTAIDHDTTRFRRTEYTLLDYPLACAAASAAACSAPRR